MDFRMRQELLPKVASLVTSAILISKDDALMILTAEVYSQHESIDIHCESDYLSLTLPEERNSQYTNIFCGTVTSADGKRLKSKLVLASKTMNVLSTYSTTLNGNPQVFIGPETGISFNSTATRVFFRAGRGARFKKGV